MELSLERLHHQFFAREHLHSLLPMEPLVFCICTEKETWKVTLSKKELSFEKTKHSIDSDAKITAVTSIAKALLNGDIRLSQLKKHNEIDYEGSFRHFLLLESVLWLCRDYSQQRDAVSY